jgi:HEAT repeat protein
MKCRFLLSISFVLVIGLLAGCGEKEDEDLLDARKAMDDANYAVAQSAIQAVLSSKPNHLEALSLQALLRLRAASGTGWKTEAIDWHSAIEKIIGHLQPLKNEIEISESLEDPDSDELDELEWLIRSRNSIVGIFANQLAEAVEQNPKLLSALASQADSEVTAVLLEAENCFHPKHRQASSTLIQQLNNKELLYNLLLDEIQNPDAAIRKQAIKHLGNLKDPRLIGELEFVLKKKDESPEVLYEAIVALEGLKDQQMIIPALKLATRTNVAQVRMLAAKLLGLLNAKDSIADLVRLLADANEYVKNSAMIALIQIGPSSINPLIAVLDSGAENVIPEEYDDPNFRNEYQYIANVYIDTDRLKNRRISTQAAAIQTLGALRARKAVGRLVNLFEDDDLHGDAASALTAMKEVAVPHLIQALRYPSFSVSAVFQNDLNNGNISENLQRALENHGISLSQNASIFIEEEDSKWLITEKAKHKKSTYTVRKEADNLISSRDIVRIRTAEVMDKIGDLRTLNSLSEALKSDPRKEVKAAAAKSLGTMKTPGRNNIAVDALAQALDLDDTTATNAAIALGHININNERAIRKLIAMAMDKRGRETIRRAALSALSQLKPIEAVQPMMRLMFSDETSEIIRKEAVTVLGEIKAQETVPALLWVLSTRYEDVKDFQRHMKRQHKTLVELGTAVDALGIQWTPEYPQPDYQKWGELKPIPGPVRSEVAISLGKIKGKLQFASTELAKYVTDLNSGKFPEHLRQAFKNNEIALSQNTTISVDRASEIWFVTDKENQQRYHFRKVGDNLDIYTQGDEVLDALFNALKDDERASVRRSAALALGEINGGSVISPLIDALKKDEQGIVRQEAAAAFSKIKGEKIVGPLLTSLKKDKFEKTRKQAAITLRDLKQELADGGLVDVLKKGLGPFEEKHEVQSVMNEVITTLITDGNESTVNFLLDALESADEDEEWIRWAVVHTIGEIRAKSDKIKMTAVLHQDMMDAIRQELAHQSYLVRKEAVAALGKLKDRKAVADFIKVLEDTNESKSIRATAATSLGMLLDEHASAPLLAALDDEHAEVRLQAATALGVIKDANAVKKLVEILQTPLEVTSVRAACITALGLIGDNSSEVAILRIFRAENGTVYKSAITALGKLKSSGAVTELIAILEDRSMESDTRTKAADALAAIGGSRAAESISRRLVDDTEYGVTITPDTFTHNPMFEAFVKASKSFQLPGFVAHKMIERIARSKPESWPIKAAAANALGRSKTPEAILRLRELLTDRRIEVRQSAALGIGEGKLRELQDEIVKIMKGETEADKDVRRGATQGVGEFADPSTVPDLIAVFNTETNHEEIRRDAAIALGKIGTDAAVSALIQKLQALPTSPMTKNLRLDIIKGLSASKHRSAILVLEKVLNDEDPEIHFWTADALFQITGEGHGYHRAG